MFVLQNEITSRDVVKVIQGPNIVSGSVCVCVCVCVCLHVCIWKYMHKSYYVLYTHTAQTGRDKACVPWERVPGHQRSGGERRHRGL